MKSDRKNSLLQDQQGSAFLEYLILVVMVAIACAAAFADFGVSVSDAVTAQGVSLQEYAAN